jgi:hypothetical protein
MTMTDDAEPAFLTENPIIACRHRADVLGHTQMRQGHSGIDDKVGCCRKVDCRNSENSPDGNANDRVKTLA